MSLKIERNLSTERYIDGFKEVERLAKIVDSEDVIVFEQNVTAPANWSDTAVNIVAQKYFRVVDGIRESSVKQMVSRVVSAISKAGVDQGYLDSESEHVFFDELCFIFMNQIASPNSPVWFNVGVDKRPRASACFINRLDDTMESILELTRTEGMIFKHGGGAGVNLSNLRAADEGLSCGGTASGPLSFMKGWDAFAGIIKSGGKCLAPDQRVYTVERGPVPVSDLSGSTFHVLSFDPPAGRFKVKRATAWREEERKRIVRVETDKGIFRLSEDHPVKLATGSYIRAGDLRVGTPLFATTLDETEGRVRVGLRDGRKGRAHMDRLVAGDVLGEDLRGKVVHHRDGNPLNDAPENLEVMTQAVHAALHGLAAVDDGMHRSGSFWTDDGRVNAYRNRKCLELEERGVSREMQDIAATSRMRNLAWRILELGGSIETFEDYWRDRRQLVGKITESKRGLLRKIERRFGSFDGFREAVAAANHRIVSIELEDFSNVYDVEVECQTADDKSLSSGHNFLIWSGDSRFGSGIVVSNTRRAAKMVIMDADHPNIEEFIDSKAHEEEKARALEAAGYSGGIEGEATTTVAFQNENHSVRVTDEFMEAAMAGDPWHLVSRKSGRVARTVDASELLDQISDSAWRCGDPGMQFDTAINSWHTCPHGGRIKASNPCSEYMFLDDSACNLASINLVKFLDEDGKFDVKSFRHVVDIMLLAQEILVSLASYPTEAIDINSKRFRPLGLGYTNLGAALMTLGLPYDSDEGREWAAAVTALMHCRALRTSSRFAQLKGAFDGFAPEMLDVVAMHHTHALALSNETTIAIAAKEDSLDAIAFGRKHGYRNAQVTVLAPTGTISFMMDCESTGVEPLMALETFKQLVGGGTVRQVARCAERWLEERPLVGHPKQIIGNMEFNHDQTKIRQTALGDNALDPRAHLEMMAAVQPFISGAISKTVNIPASATVEDVRDIYVKAWEHGLKAIAIYRDGCKTAQPVSLEKDISKLKEKLEETRGKTTLGEPEPAAQTLTKLMAEKADQDVEEFFVNSETLEKVPTNEIEVNMQTRKRLPATRRSLTHKFEFGGSEGYITVGLYDDGQPGEIFLCVSKEGSTLSGLLDAFATSVSIGLQYGVPLGVLINKFAHTRFEPSGWSNEKKIGHANSILDYIFRWLEITFMEETDDAPAAPAPTNLLDGPPCPNCGAITARAGTCHTCPTCGTTTGCG